MLPCGNLICLGPCVTRCKIITSTEGIQGSKNSPHFHKRVICGGVGNCLSLVNTWILCDMLVYFPSKVISYMMLQLSTIWPYNSPDSTLHELCHMSHLACFWFNLIQNYPDVVHVAVLYVGISRIFRESSTVDYPTCFDRSSNLERFQARVQRHHYGSCCSVLSAYIEGT